MTAPVSVILSRKGVTCRTIAPDASLAEAARQLTDHGIGALVVSGDGARPDGIVSERDLVRALAERGESALGLSVADVMTTPVETCTRATSTDQIMATMTERRIRHVPVLEAGRLAGIVSIGDVVKWRMDELSDDAERLQEYVRGGY